MPASRGGGGGVRARQKPRAKVRPKGVFAGPQVKAPSITAPQRRRVARAREALPREHSFPRLPVVKHPSPQQAHAIRKAGLRGLERHARDRGLPGAESARRDLLAHGDQETRKSVKALDHAQRVQEARRGRALGLRGSDRQVVRTLGAAELALRTGGAQVKGYKKKGRGVIAAANYPFAKLSARFGEQLASSGATGLGGRALQDVVSLPSTVIPAAYNTTAAATDLARGKPGKAKALAHEFTAGDPIALAVQGKWDEALKAVEEHPGLAALEVAGGLGAASRTAGFAARAGRRPGLRPARTVPGTAIRVQERYSKGLVGSSLQKRADRKDTARAHTEQAAAVRLRARAKVADRAGDYRAAQRLDAEADRRFEVARSVDPTRVRERGRLRGTGDIARLADQREALGQGARREQRARTVKRGQEITGRRGGTLQTLIVQGIVRPDVGEIRAYVRALEDASHDLKGAPAAANRRLRRQILHDLEHRKLDLGELAGRAKEYAAFSRGKEAQAVERGLLGGEEARLARLKPYAVAQMGARSDARGVLVLPGAERGARAGEIEAHMRERGVNPDDIAFVTHRPGGLGASAYNARWFPRKGIPTRRRSGRAVLQGTFVAGRDALVEQPTRTQGLLNADENFVRGLSEVGIRDPRTNQLATVENKADAQEIARQMTVDANGDPLPGSVPLRVVRVNPWGGRESQLQRLLDESDAEGFVLEGGAPSHPVAEAVVSAVKGEGEQGPWAVVPEEWAKRIEDHALVTPTSSPTGRALTSALRTTVLPFSPSWMTGNVVESALRSLLVGASPIPVKALNPSLRTFRRVIAEMARHEDGDRVAAELLDRVSGGQSSLVLRGQIHATSQQLSGSFVYPVARALEVAAKTPGPKQVGSVFKTWTQSVFWANRKIESRYQQAIAGRFMRNLMDERGITVSSRAVEQAARGLRDTNAQVEMARYVERAYGKYEGFSPGARKFLVLYTPFGAWTRNAVQFLTDVLPRDHPALTAAIAANGRANDKWLEENGLIAGRPGAVPNFLLGSIPTSSGPLRLSRYTPFSLGADPGQSVAGLVLPYASGSLSALSGRDWKGTLLRNGDGTPYSTQQRFAYAARELAFATIPIIGQAHRVAYEKKGPLPQRLRDVFNPFEPVHGPGTQSVEAQSSSGNELDAVDWSKVDLDAQSDLDGIDWSKVQLP